MITNVNTTSTQSKAAMLWEPGANPKAVMRLFCFPYAGGSAMVYRGWADRLPKAVEVCPVELPGRGRRMREPAFTRLAPLVEALADDLMPYLDKPFAFFGHSMGGLISFQLAKLLKRLCGTTPMQIFVSSRRAPHLPNDVPLTYNLPEEEFLEDLRRLNGTPKEVLEHRELLQLLVPLLRADFEICQTYEYTPGPPLDCPVTAFGGILDPDVLPEHLDAWREQTIGAFRLHVLPGDHFFLHTSQAELLRKLTEEMHALVGRIVRNGAVRYS